MLVNLYKSKTPLAVFSFPLLVGLLSLPLLFIENTFVPTFFSWQFDLSMTVLNYPVIHYATVILIVTISGVGLNLLVNKYGFYSKNTYLPGVIFVLALAGLGQLKFSMLLLAYPFLIFGLGYLFQINRQESAISSVFMSAFFFGITTVFEPLLFPVLLLPWFALMIFKPFLWREWFMLFLGLSIPWLYHYGVYFAVTGDVFIPPKGFAIINKALNLSSQWLGLLVFMALLVIYSIFRFLVILNNQLLVFKKRTRLLFHFIWLTIISFTIGWILFDHAMFVLTVPLSIIAAIQMLHSKREMYINFVLVIWVVLIALNLIL